MEVLLYHEVSLGKILILACSDMKCYYIELASACSSSLVGCEAVLNKAGTQFWVTLFGRPNLYMNLHCLNTFP